MKTELIRLEIQGIVLDKETQTPIMILKDEKHRRILPVMIGPFEASAIIIEMEGMLPPRPLTHDLLAQFFKTHGFSMISLQFYAAYEESYLAKVSYRKGLRRFEMEVRPSDGIALAMRLGAPMLATESVFLSETANRLFFTAGNPETAEYLYLGKTVTGVKTV